MKTFESVKSTLIKKNIPFEIVSFTDIAVSARTSDTSIDHNYNPENSIKTLVVSTKEGQKAVILRGNDRIDQAKLKAIVGKWSVVNQIELENTLGYIAGTICPLDLDLPILVDESAKNLLTWSMGAGANDKGFNVQSDIAINNLSNCKIINVRQD